MALPDVDTALGWRGSTVVDSSGEELGKVTGLYLDGESQRPAWAGVKRGFLRGRETIVPLDGAEEVDGTVRVAYDKATVEEAPDVDPDVELTEDEERALHEHYGRDYASSSGTDTDTAGSGDVAPPSDTETDTAMTRSEEEVTFGKRVTRRAERVRLKKVLVHDEVTQTVPVRKEVIKLETDAPPEGEVESVEDVDTPRSEADARPVDAARAEGEVASDEDVRHGSRAEGEVASDEDVRHGSRAEGEVASDEDVRHDSRS
jgi:PRC-barrel domain protein